MSDERPGFPFYGFFGLAIIVIGELLLFLRVSVVPIYFTPIEWSGYILFVDGLNYRIRRESLIRSRPTEFLVMLPWSVFCWLVFELYNLYLQNWIYTGLPQNIIARAIGYVWSFASIFPAVLETADLLQVAFERLKVKAFKISRPALYVCITLGFLCLSIPMFLAQSTARYFIPFLWLGFALLLEPINFVLGGRSLFRYFEQGELKQLLSLMLSAVVCGVLWEFWNYWAEARWIYNLPFSWSGPKIFEMPLLGFLGFIPFAIECHAMQNYLLVLLKKKESFDSQTLLESI
jgi:hypothetical protein